MSDVEISRKIDGILKSPSRRPDTNREILEQLQADLITHMRFLTGDAERDLDRIDAEFDIDLHSNAAIYVGSWNGIRRLLLGVEIRGDDAHLALRATKGDVDIFDIDWGQSGPHIGNAVVVGRLLHVGICSFRRNGCVE